MRTRVKIEMEGTETAPEIFAALLKSRGFTTKQEAAEFLRPPVPSLDYLIDHISIDRRELDRARGLIRKAIEEGKDICVFGDYDADGITSTAILWQTLTYLAKGGKARVMPFIPDRIRHGYGLSEKAVDDILTGTAFHGTAHPDFRPHLIITVDNGIVADKPVDILKEKGISVIITDHHQKAETVPRCDALIHSVDTSGAGIAYLAALYFADDQDFVARFIDLAAIGIVADQIPLLGVNRSIVVAGLKQLNSTENYGLRAVLERAGIAGRTSTAYEINYVIAPRINAVGRLDNPVDALRLLCARDTRSAELLADTVEKHNSSRQELTDTAVNSALKNKPSHNISIAYSEEFHEGIIGLVAGKLVEAHSRPAIAISMGEKISKGSARSLRGINITSILREHKSMLLGVGGHELAGGFSIETGRIPQFIEALYAYADKNIDRTLLEKEITADMRLELSQATMTLARLLSALEPYGMGNAKPKFSIQGIHVLEDRVIGKNGNHRKLVIEKGGVTRDVIWFNGSAAHPMKEIKEMICSIEINRWRDKESVQLSAHYVETD